MNISSYSPVSPDFEEIIQQELQKKQKVRIHYFDQNDEWEMTDGQPETLLKDNQSIFLVLDTGIRVRIDRIITIHGKPGPKYDEFETFGNACLDCNVRV